MSVLQNHYRAPIVQTFKNITIYATCNFFVSEISLIYKVPDDDSGEPQRVAHCCMILKCRVAVTLSVFQHSKCDGLNQYKKGTFGLRMLVLQSRDICSDVWSPGVFAFKFSRYSPHFVHFCARQEDCGTAVVVSWAWLHYSSLVLMYVIIVCLLSGHQLTLWSTGFREKINP